RQRTFRQRHLVRRGVRDRSAGGSRSARPAIGRGAAHAPRARSARSRRTGQGSGVRTRAAAVETGVPGRGERLSTMPARRALAACVLAAPVAFAGPPSQVASAGPPAPAAFADPPAPVASADPSSPIEPTEPPTSDAAHRDAAIDAMRGYLARAVRTDGWFVYARDGQGDALPGYNVVRHAGTMLAMSQALIDQPDDAELRHALASSARRLIACCIAPVRFERALAVWWPPRPEPDADPERTLGPPALRDGATGGDRLASL